ncbi:hypothetical protein V6Z11_A01G052400 [Gossypium hirsutum]
MEYSSFPFSFSSLLNKLPKEKWCRTDLSNWESFWYTNDSDVILTSSMKSCTTWLKAIILTIMNPISRTNDDSDDPLLKHSPNKLKLSLEVQIFKENPNPDLSYMPSPRLFQTHVPYPMLPQSDTFVSLWHFLNSLIAAKGKDPWSMNESFESFYKGIKRPEKILFLRYEDMMEDPKTQLRRLACFLGRPFEKEEEVDKVLWRCSLERLKKMEVNQHGVDPRRGIVGDWKNNMTDKIKEKLDHMLLP